MQGSLVFRDVENTDGFAETDISAKCIFIDILIQLLLVTLYLFIRIAKSVLSLIDKVTPKGVQHCKHRVISLIKSSEPSASFLGNSLNYDPCFILSVPSPIEYGDFY